MRALLFINWFLPIFRFFLVSLMVAYFIAIFLSFSCEQFFLFAFFFYKFSPLIPINQFFPFRMFNFKVRLLSLDARRAGLYKPVRVRFAPSPTGV